MIDTTGNREEAKQEEEGKAEGEDGKAAEGEEGKAEGEEGKEPEKPKKVKNESLPDLQEIVKQLTFDAEATHHSTKSSYANASISRAHPIYLSRALVSEQETQVCATEAEAFKGDRPWDMNPVIFYRVKSPATGLENLPVLDLFDHFAQKEEREQISFTVMNADIDPAEIQKISIDDEKSVELFEVVKGFTPDQDMQILKILDEQLQNKNL